MILKLTLATSLLITGCTSTERSESDEKSVLYCIGACILATDETTAKDRDTEVKEAESED